MKNMLKDTAVLFLITVIAGLILSVVYQVTKEPIAAQELNAKTQARQEVFAEADHFVEAQDFSPETAQAVLSEGGYESDTLNEYAAACDKDGNVLGYVITVTSHEGYGGDIQFTIGVQNDGTLNGMSFLSIAETAGLGMKAEDVLAPQFAGKNADTYEYTKTGAAADNQIDAISGATITTDAVTSGVNAGLWYFQTELKGGSAQ